MLSQALQKEEYDLLADPLLEKNYVGSEMFRMIEVAAACVRHSAAKRPGMGQVNSYFTGKLIDKRPQVLFNGTAVSSSSFLCFCRS